MEVRYFIKYHGIKILLIVKSLINCIQLQNNYDSSIVVFDGYGNGTSTKDHEHRRRSKGIIFPYVLDVFPYELDMVAHKQNDFLSNQLNKSQFISLLEICLQTKGFTVHQSPNDADTLFLIIGDGKIVMEVLSRQIQSQNLSDKNC